MPRTSPVFLSKENPFRGGHGALRPGRLCASLAGNLGLTAPAVKCAPLVADCCAVNQHRLAGPNQHRRAPHGLEVRNPNEVAGQGWWAGSLHSFRRLWGSTGPLLFHLLEVPETLPSPTPSIFKVGNGQLSLCRPHHRGPASLFHSEGGPCDDPGPTM